jgi:hypothetical protein
MNNHKVSASVPAALPSAGRREDERIETDRRAADGKDLPSRPRSRGPGHAPPFHRRIQAEHPGGSRSRQRLRGVGVLLRREGLYSSLLTTWQREREAGVRQALTPQKRGPKSKRDPVQEENQKLQRDNQRLTEQLRKAEIVIDVQKKMAALLGWPIATPDPERKP